MTSAVQARPSERARLVGLDVLRALAIFLVLGRHMPAAPRSWPAGLRSFFDVWQRGGWVGVDLFFVLSGFLISGLLFAEYDARGRISPLRFYARRAWKIYPPFFTLIAFTILIAAGPVDLLDHRLLSEVFFLQSYQPGIWPHSWSLAVEEHFYLLLPLVLLLILATSSRSEAPFRVLPRIGAVLAVVGLLSRLYTWHRVPGYSHLGNLYPTHLRFDSLFFGVVLAYFHRYHSSRFLALSKPWRVHLLAGGVVLLLPAFMYRLETTPFIYTAGLTLFYLGSGMLLVAILQFDLQDRAVLRPVVAVGRHSYSTYLWHLPMLLWAMPLMQRTFDFRFGFATGALTYIVTSLVAGVVMTRLVEYPALFLRDRWFPARSDGAGAASPALATYLPGGVTLS